VQAEGVADKARIVQGDIFKEVFGPATVVTMYLVPQLNVCVRHRILAMEPGTRVVSHQFPMADWEPDESAEVQGRNVYPWVVPARVDGVWDFRDAQGKALTIELRQTFAKVAGEITRGRVREPLLSAELRGRDLRFSFDTAGATAAPGLGVSLACIEVPAMDERRVAVITGAASGIGRATALELGRAGYALALCDLDPGELERTAAAVKAGVAQVVDVSRAEDVARLAQACRERFGRVDVLVNNAGILRLGAWQDLDEADWRRLFEVNLLAVARVTRAFLPLLAASRGHVINLGSGASLLPFPGYAAYGPVKVGALWLSEYLRAELGTRMGDAGQAGITRQPDWLFHSPEHVARLIRRTIGSRRFLVYGSLLLHVLHLAYRWAPGPMRAVLSATTRKQLRAGTASAEPRA